MALGGTTVEELKRRMTYTEAVQWMGYRQKHGAIGEARTAYLLACMASMFNNAHGGKATLQDFLPGIPTPEPDVIDDAEQLMMYWNQQ